MVPTARGQDGTAAVVNALRAAADAAWAEVESLRQEVNHALSLDDVSLACQVHTDEAYAAYQRARARAVAAEQLADHDEGGYNPWSAVA
jgi:hypothetical protein